MAYWPGGDKCPICKKDSSECPHSFSQMDARADDDRIRKIVKQELANYKCPCQQLYA